MNAEEAGAAAGASAPLAWEGRCGVDCRGCPIYSITRGEEDVDRAKRAVTDLVLRGLRAT